VVVLPKNLTDAIIIDREAVSDPEDVCDDDRASAEALAKVKNLVFDVVGIVCVGSAAGRFWLWDLPALTVGLGELLDSSPTALELLGDQTRVHAVVDNSLTHPGGIILIEFHFTRLIAGEIAPTKFLADTIANVSHQTRQEQLLKIYL
jgi:hypothetical protein